MSPYQFVKATSLCQVGSVWEAVDEQGRKLSVAVLDAAVASDQRWRDAFSGTAHALAQPGAAGPVFVHADFAATAPWVAYPADAGPGAERLFAALGMECQPMAADAIGSPTVTLTTIGNPVTPAAPATPTAPGAAAPGSPPPGEDGLDDNTTRFAPGTGSSGSPWQAGPPQPTSPAPQVTPARQVSGPPADPAGAATPQPVSVPPGPAAPDPVSAPPIPGPAQPVSVPPHSVSAPPGPVSVPPHQVSGPPQPSPETASPYAFPSGPADDPLYSPVRHIVPSEPQPSRKRLWIALAAVLALVLLGGGTAVAVTVWGGDPEDPPTPTASTLPPAPPPTNPPLQPGIEPPVPGAWPTQWPTFTERDNVKTLTNLDGIGFQIKVPATWECALVGRAEGYAKYNCGVPPGVKPNYGGELIVRDCPQPCDETQQLAMRQAEEAWGQRWIRSGQYSTYAETSSLQQDGEQRHGLVVVAFFRSGSEGVIDRQLVLRLTGPVNGAQELRRVATYLRDTLIF